MIQWLSEWWRFLVMAVVVSVINAVVWFLPGYLAAGIATYVNFIVGGNMIFDLINRSAWQRKVQDQAEQISDRDRTIEARDREIEARNREIQDRDREIRDREREVRDREREIQDRDREIAELRRQVEEGRNGKDAG